MNSDFHKNDAIDFLNLVRQDLEQFSSVDTPSSAVITHSGTPADFEALDLPDWDMDLSARHLGRFEIIEQIGEGGFARVFVARDPNLDREVALKVPKPHALVSSEARSRFEREAKSAAILSHPNIVPVFESGSAGPICFIASEYCPGENLRTWYTMSKKKPTPRKAVEIVCQLADALQHAHRRGIIHRDLKPSNIIVAEGDDEITKRLRITDFGLARHVSNEDSLTANGAIVGTPAYMSPEQAEGINKVDHRSDVYSLGMIFYELLTGNIPFKRSSHIASIAAVINEAVPRPRQMNHRVDADLEAICMKALEKAPDSRYQSAYDLKRDLERWLSGNAVSVRNLAHTEIARRWVVRNPLVASAILFGLFCLTAGFAFSFIQWKKTQSKSIQLIEQRDRAEKNVDELHKTIISSLEVTLDSLEDRVQLLPAQQVVLDQLMDAHIRLIEEEAEEVEITPETFECYERLARIYSVTGRHDKAREICERAEKVLKSCLANPATRKKFALSASNIMFRKGRTFDAYGDTDSFLSLLEKAEEYFLESETGVDRVKWLEEGYYLYREIAFLHHSRRDVDLCLPAFEKSASMAVEAVGLNPEDEQLQFNVAKSFVDVSHVYRSTDEWPIGLENLERAEELFEKAEARFLAGPRDLDPKVGGDDYKYRLAYIRNEIALYLRRHVKDYELAEQYSLRAIESLTELVKDHPGQLGYQNRLAHAYQRLIYNHYEQGMFDQVLQMIDDSLEMHRLGKPPWSEQRLAFCETLRGKIWAFEYDEPELAEAAFNRAIEIVKTSDRFNLGDEDLVSSLLETHRQRDLFYDKFGEYEKAKEAAAEGYRLAIQAAFEHPGEHNVETARQRGTYYANKIYRTRPFGLVKQVLDTTAEATRDSASAQYALAHHWAKIDSRQRDDGVERKIWRTSRNRSIQLLARAIDLGFADYKRIQEGRYFSGYLLLPEFKAIVERIKPDAQTAK